MEEFRIKTYPIPYRYKEDVNKAIKQLLEDEIIEHSDTPYINPIVIVKKSDGYIRICLDARNLNKHTIPEFQSPQTIEALIGMISNAKIFSKLDLKHSFWLIPLHENSRQYCEFKVDGSVYQFKVTPFGIQSATAALMKTLHKVLRNFEDFVLHYVDDILIYYKDEKQRHKHLDIVLRRLDEVGLINYFKRLMPNISEKIIPLVELLKRNVKLKWNEEHENAFIQIENDFVKELKIYHSDH